MEEIEPQQTVRGFFKDAPLVKMFFFIAFSSTGFGLFYIILPFYIFAVIGKDDYTFYGLIITLSFILSASLIIPSGIFADRYNRVFLIKVGSLCVPLGSFLLYFADVRMELILATLLIYLGYPLFGPSMAAIIADRTKGYGQDLGYAIIFGSQLAFFGVGNFLLFVFQSLNVEFDLDGLRFTVLIFAFLNLMAGIFAFSIRHKRPNKKGVISESDSDGGSANVDNGGNNVKGGYFGFLRRNMAWRVVLIYFIVGFGAGFIVPFFQLFFEDRFGLELGTIGLIFAVQQLFMGLGNFTAPVLSRSFRRIPTMVFTQVVSIICALYLAFSHHLALAIIAFIARGTLMNVANPLVQSLMMDLVGEEFRGVGSANLSLAFMLGNAPSPIMSGSIIDSTNSYKPSFFAMSGLYAIAALILTSLNQKDKEAMEKHITVERVTPKEMPEMI